MKNLHVTLFVLLVVFGSGVNGNAPSDGPKHRLVSEGCKCYTEGAAFSPGTKKCLGGNQAICIAKTGVGDSARNCGWDYRKDEKGNMIKCQNN